MIRMISPPKVRYWSLFRNTVAFYQEIQTLSGLRTEFLQSLGVIETKTRRKLDGWNAIIDARKSVLHSIYTNLALYSCYRLMLFNPHFPSHSFPNLSFLPSFSLHSIFFSHFQLSLPLFHSSSLCLCLYLCPSHPLQLTVSPPSFILFFCLFISFTPSFSFRSFSQTFDRILIFVYG